MWRFARRGFSPEDSPPCLRKRDLVYPPALFMQHGPELEVVQRYPTLRLLQGALEHLGVVHDFLCRIWGVDVYDTGEMAFDVGGV